MITGFVQGQMLRLSAPVVAADTLDYLTAQFVFRSADWGGMEKWAHFAKGGTVYDVRLTEDKIRREDHLNLGAGEWKVYIHGNRFADGTVVERITTAEDVLRVVPTGALNGEPFPEMPASVTEQILARLEDVEQNGGGSGGGYSPEVKVERVEGGVKITITDKDGTTSEVVQDGKPGVHVGSDAPPVGTKVWVNPNGENTKIPKVDDTLTKPGYAADAAKVGEKIDELHERLEDVEQNGGGTGGGIANETDPTVPDWAKQPEKPTYTAKEVGAATKEQVDDLSKAIADKRTSAMWYGETKDANYNNAVVVTTTGDFKLTKGARLGVRIVEGDGVGGINVDGTGTVKIVGRHYKSGEIDEEIPKVYKSDGQVLWLTYDGKYFILDNTVRATDDTVGVVSLKDIRNIVNESIAYFDAALAAAIGSGVVSWANL